MQGRNLSRRTEVPEFLDGPLTPSRELDGNLDDLARINRWTGAHLLLQAALTKLLRHAPAGGFSFLDVGGGGGEGVAAAQRWARRRGRCCRGILLDQSPAILALARQRQQGLPISVLHADGRALPLLDGSVDVVSCSLVLHHLSDADALQLLRELGRVARRGVIVDDLLRSRVGLVGARALARLATTNRLTRHDAPLSVRRAFTAPVLRRLASASGLRLLWQARLPGYRLTLACAPGARRLEQ